MHIEQNRAACWLTYGKQQYRGVKDHEWNIYKDGVVLSLSLTLIPVCVKCTKTKVKEKDPQDKCL